MHDSRTVDVGTPTTIHYTVKTTSRPSPTSPAALYTFAHAHPHSHSSPQSFRLGGRSTPTASPRHPCSVGQTFPPLMSPARAADARSPSPNYFGLVVESNMDPRDSGIMPTQNWSPPTSSVRSFAAALPKQVPLDANPDFEAFKRQADLNRGKGFGLSIPSGAGLGAASAGGALAQTPGCGAVRPRITRCSSSTLTSDRCGQEYMAPRAPGGLKDRPPSRMDVDQDSLHDSAYVSADSKRNSGPSLAPPTFLNLNMPPKFDAPPKLERINNIEKSTALSRSEDRDPRLSVTETRPEMPSTGLQPSPRPESVPTKMNEGGPCMIAPSRLRALLGQDGSGTNLLLLDIRPSQSFILSHVTTALNLCIPTTLLKRASHDLQKLQQTFHNPEDKDRFSHWGETDYLVVYDAHSFEKREATAAINMIKKFTSQGYLGQTYILRGGFDGFRDTNSDLVDTLGLSATSSGPNSFLAPAGLAPVIGGVMLPAATTANPTNPFFSNIRQNMDLADGVGQLEIVRPTGLESPGLFRWLREAVSRPDKGKTVSDKFLAIEQDEQSRMQRAYAAFGPTAARQKPPVQLCGIEQGGKNRYKDILPFEHARVKLSGRPDGASDYINASHVKASRSNKHYIATQGPLPTTFEDFWSVIWDQDVRVVVMLTAESEGGQLKCHQYWSGKDYGSIRLKALSEKKVSLDLDKHRSYSNVCPSAFQAETSGRRRANTTTTLDACVPTPGQTPSQSETPYVVIRKFALSHAAHPFAPIREITHLHYPSWPDFGAPAQPSHLLALVELANVMQRAALPFETSCIVGGPTTAQRNISDAVPASIPPISWYDEPEADARARPMLVHCSAGCGRTGTFCTVDSVIDMLKRQRLSALTYGDNIRQHDAQGDVCMAGSDAGNISPHTTPTSIFFSSPRSTQALPMALRRFSNSSSSGGPMTRVLPPAPLDISFVDNDGVDLIQRTVEDFRTQRISMVQSLRQFVLCYETVLEWVWRLQERGATLGHRATNGGAVPTRARSGSLQAREA